jgi:type 1 glutamine amidotransferase
MRLYSNGWVLGCLVLACSSPADKSSSLGASPPPFVPGGSTMEAPPSPGGGQPPAANGADDGPGNGSGAEPGAGEAAGSGSSSAPGASAPEEPGDLPLAGDDAEPAPVQGSTDAPSTTPPESEPMPPVTVPPPQARLENVLVFTRTTGFRHGSIEPGVEALRRLGQENAFAVERTEDPADFTDERLARYDVVIWLNTDSEVMNEDARRAFERYIRAGGGWVGVHAAAATEYDWAWYGQLIGGAAYFLGHPAVQPAQVNVEIADHPSTQHLPQSFTLQDEWYSFRANPRASVRVLMTLNESSYGVGDLAMGGDHPIAWYHEFDGGRAWYTALGHPNELYTDSRFTAHLLGGIRWAAGVAP